MRVPAQGGPPASVVKPGRGETHSYPEFLPDGRRFLIRMVSADRVAHIYLASLDSNSRTPVLDRVNSAPLLARPPRRDHVHSLPARRGTRGT